MPKRSAEDQIQKYERKLRKLHKKVRKLPSETSSDGDQPPDFDPSMALELNQDPIDTPGPSNTEIEQIQEVDEPMTVPSDLDPEMIDALGVDTFDTPEYGEKIHDDLAKRWLPLLKKGLPKEVKEKLAKEYLVPDNFKLLRAPDLNVELTSVLTETVKSRDKKLKTNQQQLSTGIIAANKALNLLLSNGDKVEAVKHLSNCCRVLLDLHSLETKWRRILITLSLEKSFQQIVQDSERDETLFGNNLFEKIKNIKSSERLRLHFKKNQPSRNAPQALNNPRTINGQGNYFRPRSLPSRGGRGSHQRTTPAPQRQPSTMRTMYQNPNRGRAPTRR